MSDRSRFNQVIRGRKLLLGMIHLKPLPGSPLHKGDSIRGIIEAACEDARILLDNGFDGYIVENFGDVPYYGGLVPPHVPALMTRVALELPRDGALLVGVNVLRNDARAALAVAAAAEMDLIRINLHVGAAVTDQGVLQGRAAETVREREQLASSVAILADVQVKHSLPLGIGFELENAARETAYRGLADGLILTGVATGETVSIPDLEKVRDAVRDRPLLVGSGVTASSVAKILALADGVIVGTSLKHESRVEERIDPARAWEFAAAARRVGRTGA